MGTWRAFPGTRLGRAGCVPGWLMAAAAGLLVSAPRLAEALEERFEDLPASVEVAPVFSLSLDQPQLAFGQVSPNTTMVLGEGRFFNEIRCQSNAGRTWYLKAQLVSLRHLDSPRALDPSQLKWRIVQRVGTGVTESAQDFRPFAPEPVLLYTSSGEDQAGAEVVLRFQYSLTAPAEAPAGSYVGQLVFTMAESP